MASPISANKAELLAIATSVATEKMIDKAIVIEAMEEAIQKAARARYGAENDIRAKLDPVTGDLRLWRVVEVVEEVEDYFKQVDLKGAEKLQKDAAIGDFIVDPLPPIEFGRIAAQAAKQVIFQKVRDAERERQFEEFKDRAGEVITGVVKRVEFGHVVVDLGVVVGVDDVPGRTADDLGLGPAGGPAPGRADQLEALVRTDHEQDLVAVLEQPADHRVSVGRRVDRTHVGHGPSPVFGGRHTRQR